MFSLYQSAIASSCARIHPLLCLSQIRAVIRTAAGIGAASLINGLALPDRRFGTLLYGGGSVDPTPGSRTTGIVGSILGDSAVHITEPDPRAFIDGSLWTPCCNPPRGTDSRPRAALLLLRGTLISPLFCHSFLLSFPGQARSLTTPVIFIARGSYLLILRPVLICTCANSTSTGRV